MSQIYESRNPTSVQEKLLRCRHKPNVFKTPESRNLDSQNKVPNTPPMEKPNDMLQIPLIRALKHALGATGG